MQRTAARVDEVGRAVELMRGVQDVGLDPASRGTRGGGQSPGEVEHARAEVDADDLGRPEVPERERVAPAGALEVDRPPAATAQVAEDAPVRARTGSCPRRG